jgi:hypothetical protein
MSSINPEFGRKLAVLIREYAVQLADVQTLRGMLTLAEQGQATAEQWEIALDAARQTEAYQRISQQYEPLTQELEQMADFREIEHLFVSMPSAQIAN